MYKGSVERRVFAQVGVDISGYKGKQKKTEHSLKRARQRSHTEPHTAAVCWPRLCVGLRAARPLSLGTGADARERK